MAEAAVLDRHRAIERYLRGETATAIYQSLGYSREWFYKWLKRYERREPAWAEEQSRRPKRSPRRVASALAAEIVATRRSLARRGVFCGAQAIAWELTDNGTAPPSLRTIARVLERHGLIAHQRRPDVTK